MGKPQVHCLSDCIPLSQFNSQSVVHRKKKNRTQATWDLNILKLNYGKESSENYNLAVVVKSVRNFFLLDTVYTIATAQGLFVI